MITREPYARTTAALYAHRQTGTAATMQAYELEPELAARCIALGDPLGLDLAGIDLRLTPAADAVCFEVRIVQLRPRGHRGLAPVAWGRRGRAG
jgi:hypothetical protein